MNILVFLLNFIDYRIAGISISDWILILFMFFALVNHTKIEVSRYSMLAVGMLFLGVLISLLGNVGKDWFSLNDYFASSAKLLFYVAATLVLPDYLAHKNVDFAKILTIFIYISTIGAVFQCIVVRLVGPQSWPLFSLGSQFFELPNNNMNNSIGIMRARSFFSEPAHFAIYNSLIFALVFYHEKRECPISLHIAYIVGIVCANSISGFAIMIAVYLLYFVNFSTIKQAIRMILGFIVAIICGVGIIVSNDYISSRIVNLFALKDHSGVVRTIGGFMFLKYVPIYGTGLGNHANYYKSLTDLSDLWFSGSGEFYNVILLALVTMGIIGCVGLVFFEFQELKSSKKLFFLLLLTHFAWGKLFTTPIWIFVILYKIMKKKKEEEYGNG